MSPETERHIIELETKVAYQEDALIKLQKKVLAQQTQLYQMEKKWDKLLEQMKKLRDDGGGQEVPNEKPPHY